MHACMFQMHASFSNRIPEIGQHLLWHETTCGNWPPTHAFLVHHRLWRTRQVWLAAMRIEGERMTFCLHRKRCRILFRACSLMAV